PHPNPSPGRRGLNSLLPLGEGLGMSAWRVSGCLQLPDLGLFRGEIPKGLRRIWRAIVLLARFGRQDTPLQFEIGFETPYGGFGSLGAGERSRDHLITFALRNGSCRYRRSLMIEHGGETQGGRFAGRLSGEYVPAAGPFRLRFGLSEPLGGAHD